MYIENLSILTCPRNLAVGWLDEGHSFPQGATSAFFRLKLKKLTQSPSRKMRGFHICQFCIGESTRGNGEIDVRGLHGLNDNVFISPALISHYVDEHDYYPPNEFIESVESLDIDSYLLDVSNCILSNLIAQESKNPGSVERVSLFTRHFWPGESATTFHITAA